MKIRGDALEVDTMGITYLLYNANLTTNNVKDSTSCMRPDPHFFYANRGSFRRRFRFLTKIISPLLCAFPPFSINLISLRYLGQRGYTNPSLEKHKI